MTTLQALLGSLARSRAQALVNLRALDAAEGRVTIDPPVWCRACGRMLVASGPMCYAIIDAVCPDCAPKDAATHRERRNQSEQRLRELVEVTRLLAWHVQADADGLFERGCHESARVLRELADAANSAIEALRANQQED